MQSDAGTAVLAGAMGIAALIAVLILIIPGVFFCLTLKKALDRCSPESRAMQPGMVWLLLIPLFNIVWQFLVVINMAKSLGAEFKKRGIAAEPEPGKTLGLIFCVLNICGLIPVIGMFLSLGGLVCWIIYWVKIADFSKKIAAPAA